MGSSNDIEFHFYELPKSVNGLYYTRGARRVLTAVGKRYKNAFISSRGGLTAAQLMSFRPDPDGTYALDLWFFVEPERLYNFTYGSDKRVLSPYKDFDASNLIKLAEDAVAELLGIRDRNNFDVSSHKRSSLGKELTVARVALTHNIDDRTNPWLHLTSC